MLPSSEESARIRNMAKQSPRKRRRLENQEELHNSKPSDGTSRRPISPPAGRLASLPEATPLPRTSCCPESSRVPAKPSHFIRSPVQLNNIPELPSSNVDTVSLRDILGDPLISECWLFNYLFDVDFILSQFDEDVRDLVRINLVHGSWKREDTNKIHIDEAVKSHANLRSITAHMPEAYGTHHSKMIVLFRHDDLAQVILLTANFLARDWRMSQAIWRSPLMPLQTTPSSPDVPQPRLGSGPRFKLHDSGDADPLNDRQKDLLAYLRGYSRLRDLIEQLRLYDFGAVRGALVASIPSRVRPSSSAEGQSLWGLPGLKRILQAIPSNSTSNAPPDIVKMDRDPSTSQIQPSGQSRGHPHVIIQISSVATIGEKWPRDHLLPSLGVIKTPTLEDKIPPPKFSVVFPTADEIRRSIDGYGSGGSIHMRTQSSAQMKQLDYLRPMLRHWAGDQENNIKHTELVREAGRRRAAPHIKTYVRFSESTLTKIDWAMMTSANLSTQAWGTTTKEGQWRVCSYEIGIVIWPALWDEEGIATTAEMVPVFNKDTPEAEDSQDGIVRVGWRMPYDLPLVPYQDDEMPWCASAPCQEPDWMGRTWPGFGNG